MNQPNFRCILLGVTICVLQLTEIAKSEDLIELKNCTLVKTDWADGDSFRVKDADGKQYTFVCIAWIALSLTSTTPPMRDG